MLIHLCARYDEPRPWDYDRLYLYRVRCKNFKRFNLRRIEPTSRLERKCGSRFCKIRAGTIACKRCSCASRVVLCGDACCHTPGAPGGGKKLRMQRAISKDALGREIFLAFSNCSCKTSEPGLT